MTPIHILGKVNRANYIQFCNTDWIVYVSVYVYTFLKWCMLQWQCLAQCSGMSQQLRHYQKGFLPLLCNYHTCIFLASSYSVGFPRWLMGSLDNQRVNEVDCGLMTQVFYVLFFHMVPKRSFNSGPFSLSLSCFSAYRDYIWLPPNI